MSSNLPPDPPNNVDIQTEIRLLQERLNSLAQRLFSLTSNTPDVLSTPVVLRQEIKQEVVNSEPLEIELNKHDQDVDNRQGVIPEHKSSNFNVQQTPGQSSCALKSFPLSNSNVQQTLEQSNFSNQKSSKQYSPLVPVPNMNIKQRASYSSNDNKRYAYLFAFLRSLFFALSF